MPHWASKYVGTPYQEGARGPVFFDCWGIIQLIYREERGITLAEHPGLAAPQTTEITNAILEEAAHNEIWSERRFPVEGCIVTMGVGEKPHHVGIWVDCDGGKVLHCRNGQNTIAETLRSIRLRGMRHIKFYQHTQWPG